MARIETARLERGRAQVAARVAGLVFVVAWLFSGRLQAVIPFWLPFVVLAATELEFFARGLRERRAGERSRPPERRLPGPDDADLGWVEVEGEDGEPRLIPAPPRARRRSRLIPSLIGIGLALLLFVAAARVDRLESWSGLSQSDRQRAERRFTTEAAAIAGQPVRVACDDSYTFTGVGSDTAGIAFIRRGLAYLEPDVCRSLYRISFERKLGPRDDAAFAITVLAHEATHLRGVRDEAQTECFALQEGVGLGTRLGLDRAEARELMRSQFNRDLADDSVARLDYRLPAGCRNGGPLDLRPEDPTFP